MSWSYQTSVYQGTAGGAALTGFLAQRHGWRSPFWVLGLAGMLYALILVFCLIEPVRIASCANRDKAMPLDEDEWIAPPAHSDSLGGKIGRIVSNPAAALLLVVFVGANFVASTFLTWLPTFIFQKVSSSDWTISSFTSTLPGRWGRVSRGRSAEGSAADRAARRRRGGRIRVQSLGLILAAPFVFLTGWSTSVSGLIAGLIGAGLCKGIYDSNIFASLFDVVAPEDRGIASGLMNALGWTGGLAAPFVVGVASDRLGLGLVIGSTAAAPIY